MGDPGDRKTRLFPRYEVNALVDFTGTEVLLYHKIQNISLGGISLQSPSVEEVGTIVDLVINFPELGGSSLSIKGEVVWANREPPMDMGIRYVDMDEERREILRKYLARVRELEGKPEVKPDIKSER
jgi:hypothetical protein